MHYKDAYAIRMNELRRAKGLTEAEFMKQTVEATNGVITNKAEHYDMTIENLIAVADVLGCSTDYLLGRTDKPK